MSQQSTTFNSVKIGSIVVQANKAKIYAYKIDTVADWHEIKTLSGSTTLIPRGITSESFSLRIEWVPLIAGEDYKDLSANLNSLATSGELITVVGCIHQKFMIVG